MSDARRAESSQLQRFPLRLTIALVLASIALASCGGSTASGDTDSGDTDSAVPDSAVPGGAAEATSEPTAGVEPTTAPASLPTAEPTAVADSDVAEPTAVLIVGHDAPGGLVVPDPLEPGMPGQLIASESFALRSWNGLPMEGQRLLYHSQSAAGDDIAVSGFVVYPTGSAPEGGWPLIAWAHGTAGLADRCAPSNSAAAPSNLVPARLVAEGFAVVATDYEGLGTPGRHPYIVGASEAHSVLDSVRAVHNMELPFSDEWIAFGHSQGGHAAMFTAQLQPSYAPELELIGTIASAPPSQVSSVITSLIGGDYQGYLPMTMAGLETAFPEIELAEVLTPEALALLDVVDTGCVQETFDVFNSLRWQDIVLEEEVMTSGPLAEQLADQDTNRQPTLEPLMIIHGEADDQIPVETSAMLLEQLCAFDDQGPVLRNVYPGETHSGPVYGDTAWPDLLPWVEARFAGETAPDDCQR